MFVAYFAEDLQPILAHALEGIRAGPRLERPAAQDVRPGLFHVRGNSIQSLAALHGARAGDHGEMAPADANPSHFHHGIVLLKLAAGQLERLEDIVDLLDARDGRKRLNLGLALVADDADDRPLGSAAHVWAEPQLLDPLDDVVDLLGRSVRPDDEDHGAAG